MWEGCDVYIASAKLKRRATSDEKFNRQTKAMFSFVPPTSGMFVWVSIPTAFAFPLVTLQQVKLHLENHPLYASDSDTLEVKLWDKLAQTGVLFAPGWIFTADRVVDRQAGHFRISFSNAEVRVS
jgi:aromatic amino acid aminotransferase I